MTFQIKYNTISKALHDNFFQRRDRNCIVIFVAFHVEKMAFLFSNYSHSFPNRSTGNPIYII